jgi:hypothetical protein
LAPQLFLPHFGPLSGTHEHDLWDQTSPWMHMAVWTQVFTGWAVSSVGSAVPPHAATSANTNNALIFFTISPSPVSLPEGT